MANTTYKYHYTKADYKWLTDNVEQYLHTSLYGHYKRNTTQALNNKVADIYDKATNTQTPRTFNCGACVYNLYVKAAKLYYEDKEHYEQSKNKKQENK